jgi:cell division protein FtsI/penicillin-binding protein 2
MLGFRKNLTIKRFSRDIETDDLFLDALAKKKDKNYEMIETALSDRNFKIMFSVFCLTIFSLLFYSFYFQVVKHEYFSERADKNKIAFKEIDAQRGIIYDRNMNQLVSNIQSFDLVCNIDSF